VSGVEKPAVARFSLRAAATRDHAGVAQHYRLPSFRPEMAVHGRFGKPCPVCGTTVQRIRYAENEVNFYPRCQTGGRMLVDRSLSRLLKKDWPRTVEAAEAAPRTRHPEG